MRVFLVRFSEEPRLGFYGGIFQQQFDILKTKRLINPEYNHIISVFWGFFLKTNVLKFIKVRFDQVSFQQKISKTKPKTF